jgi:hypothetical protein
MDFACLENTSDVLRNNAQRLLRISPLFEALMRTADENECQLIFQDEVHAVLPDKREVWFPTGGMHAAFTSS